MEPRSKMLDFFPRPLTSNLTPEFMAGGGEMGERIRGHDWTHTSLGPPRDWPNGLKTAVRIMLASRQPTSIWWGSELTVLYNDACRALIGGNHPAGLGEAAPCAWREIWDDMGARVEGAIRGNDQGAGQSIPLLVERHGRVEEAHYTITFTAMPGDTSSSGGVLCSFIDVTQSIVFDRQMNLLKSVAACAMGATTRSDACLRAAEGLADGACDIPFAAIYLVDQNQREARLAASAGIARGHAALPEKLALGEDCPWPLVAALMPGARPFQPVMLSDAQFGPLPSGAWSRPPRDAAVVRLGTASVDGKQAVLIAALNPFRVMADDPRRFLELVAAQVAAAISNAQACSEGLDGLSFGHSRELVASLPAAVYTTDAAGVIQEYNQAAVELWGRSPQIGTEKWCGSSRIYTPEGEELPLDRGPMARVVRGEPAAKNFEVMIERPDGSCRHALAHPRAIRDEAGRVTGGVNMLVDITAHKAAEAELAFTKDQLALQVESLTRLHQLAMELGGISELQPALQKILDTAVEAQAADRGLVWLYDEASGFLRVEASKGFDSAGLALFRDVVPGPYGGSAGNAFANRRRWVVADTDLDPHFAPFRESARRVGFRSIHSTPIVTRAGALLGVISVHYAEPRTPLRREMQVADVCARHAADAVEAWRGQVALRASERMYRAIGESMEYGVWTAGANGGNTFLSESFLKLTGLTPDEAAGRGWAHVIHPDDLEPMLAKWSACLRGGTKWDHEYRVRGVDGRWYAILGRAVPLRDERGTITGWAGINLDIGRLKRVEDELRELDQRKNEFLATLAHELRNPLAPLRNGLEVMRLASGDAATVEKARSMMERQLGQMVRLVDDLLDVSRVSRGKIELRRTAIELDGVLRNALETSQPLMSARRHQLIAKIPAERIVLDADMTRLSQVFWNLLNNAAKYTECGGRIELSVQRAGDEVAVSVKDNGVGIPANMLSRVFDIFTQVDRSLEKSQGGLGIGLSIAKRLVEMHGGSIEARSEGSGKGSEFIVRLPARIDPSPAAPPAEASVGASAREGPRHRVLIADDNPDSAATLAIMLQVLGNDVRVAHDGREAVEMAEQFRPDAILLDIGMPRMNGYDACEKIRRQPWGADAFIVALTGWGQEEDKNRSRAAGFDRHLVKPVEPAAIEKLIQGLPPSRHTQ